VKVSSQFISSHVEKVLHRADAPYQWLGDEPGSFRKPWDEAEVRMCLFACWPYEQTAGNQAIPLVYRIVNEAPWALCDRSYFPATPRDLSLLEGKVPIFGIESKHGLLDFDVVGTSISYPVLVVNFVKQLQMSGIEPREWVRRERSAEYPMVIVGGQAYGGPEVLAGIADVVFCGEAEDEPGNPGLVAVLEAIRDFKRAGLWESDRDECYRLLAREFSFLYFPRFWEVRYGYEDRPSVEHVLGRDAAPSKQVTAIIPTLEGMPAPVVKRFVADLDAAQPLDEPPLLYHNTGLGAGDLEVGRGCPAWCSFCALTYRQKPYRQRSVESSVEFGKRLVRNTGATALTPFAPDFPMHTQKKRLLVELLTKVSDEVDTSSMRVDDYLDDDQYVHLQMVGGVETLTLGVEGNSQRMRDLVGKGTADEDIREAVRKAILAGVRRIKLYMIAFLPGEQDADVYRLLRLARDIAQIRDSMRPSVRIQFSWTPLLIEANTPMQWFAPTTINYVLTDVWDELKRLRIGFKLGSKVRKDKLALQQLSQRASREQGMAIVEVLAEHGQGSWGGVPLTLYEDLERRLVERGFLNGFADAFDERDREDMFGWEHIDQGIEFSLMWSIYEKMRSFLERTSATAQEYDSLFPPEYRGQEWVERCDDRCSGASCGVCSPRDLEFRRRYVEASAEEVSVDPSSVKVIDQRTVQRRVWLRLVRAGSHRWVEDEHILHVVRRAAFRAGVPIAKRTVRTAVVGPPARNWVSGVEYVEFGVAESAPEEVARWVEEMSADLPEYLRLSGFRVSQHGLREQVGQSLYELETEFEDPDGLLERWERATEVLVPVYEASPMGVTRRDLDVKGLVGGVWFVRDGHRLFMRFLFSEGGRVSPYAVWAGIGGKASWLEAAKFPLRRLETFRKSSVIGAECASCGGGVPESLFGEPYGDRCPRCADVGAVSVLG
jgi:radical SAM superfamily enzyme YgiQ (UPF0313 family)